tara:strand:- start:845 stop:1207 length:363 start_codon:yes stop_codon:yes gene_type:complete
VYNFLACLPVLAEAHGTRYIYLTSLLELSVRHAPRATRHATPRRAAPRRAALLFPTPHAAPATPHASPALLLLAGLLGDRRRPARRARDPDLDGADVCGARAAPRGARHEQPRLLPLAHR